MTSMPSTNLIIGDWAGNLWWLQDQSTGSGAPVYRGQPYRKPDYSKHHTRSYLEAYGAEYVKPLDKVRDEYGKLVSSAGQVQLGQLVDMRLKDGTLGSEIRRISLDKKEE